MQDPLHVFTTRTPIRSWPRLCHGGLYVRRRSGRPGRLSRESRSHRNQPLGCAWPTLYTTQRRLPPSALGLVFARGLAQFYVYGGQSGFAVDHGYNEKVASEGAKTMLGAAAAYGGFKAIESLASWYIRAQTPAQKARRARELGATEACLDAAVAMVTMPDDDNPGPAMNEGERIALARDLMHLVTVERSRVPPELWQAASSVGDDAHTLVNQLLRAARARAAAQASTSSAD